MPSKKISNEDNETNRFLTIGHPERHGVDNSVKTSKYTLFTFFPKEIYNQFRRGGNLYFLVIGLLMAIGYYGSYFKSAVSPWSTLMPLFGVVGLSIFQEGMADIARHKSDQRTNQHPCLVLSRLDTPDDDNSENIIEGKRVSVNLDEKLDSKKIADVAFCTTARSEIYAGDIVLVQNREMVPADIIILASSSEQGSAYIETSSIDGETNLKLRTNPFQNISSYNAPVIETIEQAVKRITRSTILGFPNGSGADKNPNNAHSFMSGIKTNNDMEKTHSIRNMFSKSFRNRKGDLNQEGNKDTDFISVLISEPPNPSINTFVGQLILPPLDASGPSVRCALGAENILLRGAVLRNTEWLIGVAIFTGKDTKLVRNAIKTKSKFSVLDRLVNKTVGAIIFVNFLTVLVLSALASVDNERSFDSTWYLGHNYASNNSAKWPYLPNLESPTWTNDLPNFLQLMFLFVTLLSNFVPVSLYVTMEMITFCFIYFINVDIDMYHEETDTPAIARSTNVTDLGRIEYVFTDKTGTLTENVMRFKRCSIDGLVFGAPTNKKKESDSENAKPFHPLRQLLVGGANFIDDPHSNDNAFNLADGLDSFDQNKFKYKITFNGEMFLRVMSICHTVVVEKDYDKKTKDSNGNKTKSNGSIMKREKDGAPGGFTYQAESPDEGALVGAASLIYGFQLVSRDSSGIRLKRYVPSYLDDKNVANALRDCEVTPKHLAVEEPVSSMEKKIVDEVWTILAVNKFDSDRKRMSILVRSPPELGSIPILFCKGADSSMLDKNVCEGGEFFGEENTKTHAYSHETVTEDVHDSNSVEASVSDKSSAQKEKDREGASILGLQAHLGDFASEGLRTLVLGMRVLSKKECSKFLSKFEAASTAIEDRDKKLKAVAIDIERSLHIIGATAIEDKLQDGVPDTIANLGKAGLKLWVLTGDKRETAIEIGYSTKVLTPRMQLIELVDGPKDEVRKNTAKVFMHLVKRGKLKEYQRAALEKSSQGIDCFSKFFYKKDAKVHHGRLSVRNTAESILRKDRVFDTTLNFSTAIEDECQTAPVVFKRAASARRSLELRTGYLDDIESRNISIATVTALGMNPHASMEFEFRDEDELSIESFSPRDVDKSERLAKGKHTILERLFAVDRDVRRGRLEKHQRASVRAMATKNKEIEISEEMPRALVVEGHALLHLLGNPIYEEMIFSIAKTCDAVIACRSSPQQKALLVKMVRTYVSPEPVTLAIGDGANDVGMIQEAHVGVGISGKEGQQAVNSSDFAIAQFRYLEDLVLVHGRWNFKRMSMVVLYSFYKNAVLVGLLATFQSKVIYSGTPLFNQWLTAMVNFVAGIPILFVGFFDRDVEKRYIKNNPELYGAGPDNEHMSRRMMVRWFVITVVHITILYVLSIRMLTVNAQKSSAFQGLMTGRGPDDPGDGEMDFVTYGTIIYTALIVNDGYKVIYETRSIIHGEIPFFHNEKSSKGDRWYDRLPWTWIGLLVLSYGFWMFVAYIYSYVARFSSFLLEENFNDIAQHTFNRASISWLLFLLVPITAQTCDVMVKLFSSMFFPSQTQIHIEIEAKKCEND